MTHTIWEYPDGMIALVQGTDIPPYPDPVGVKLLHTFNAASPNDAGRKRNELMGWEPYKPMLRADGTPYPEDERPFGG